MINTILGIIIFHVHEWINREKIITYPLVRQEVGHNAWKSWWKVRLKLASIKCDNTYDLSLTSIGAGTTT